VIVVVGRMRRKRLWELAVGSHRTGVTSTGRFVCATETPFTTWTRYAPGVRLEDVIVSTTQDRQRARFVKMRMSKRHRKESTSEERPRLRAQRRIVALFAALVVSLTLTLTAAASANVSFTRA
jgi:hypothetical protein